MLKAIKEFFFGKPKEAAAEAPYKVETPVTESAQQIPGIEAILITPPVVEAPVKPAAKPRTNAASKKIAAAKKPAAKKPAAPRAK